MLPLTIDQRKKPSRQSLRASSTRNPTSSRVLKDEQQIGRFHGCGDQVRGIDPRDLGRCRHSVHGPPRIAAKIAPRRCRASATSRSHNSLRLIAVRKLRQQRVRQMLERIGAGPVAPDKAADLPRKQCGKADQKQCACEFAGGDGANQKP
jgi:hypothetical protein